MKPILEWLQDRFRLTPVLLRLTADFRRISAPRKVPNVLHSRFARYSSLEECPLFRSQRRLWYFDRSERFCVVSVNKRGEVLNRILFQRSFIDTAGGWTAEGFLSSQFQTEMPICVYPCAIVQIVWTRAGQYCHHSFIELYHRVALSILLALRKRR